MNNRRLLLNLINDDNDSMKALFVNGAGQVLNKNDFDGYDSSISKYDFAHKYIVYISTQTYDDGAFYPGAHPTNTNFYMHYGSSGTTWSLAIKGDSSNIQTFTGNAYLASGSSVYTLFTENGKIIGNVTTSGANQNNNIIQK